MQDEHLINISSILCFNLLLDCRIPMFMVSVREFSSQNLSEINVSILLEKTRMNGEVTAFIKQLMADENERQIPHESWWFCTVFPVSTISQIRPITGDDFC